MTDLPAAPLGKERGHDLVATGKVTAAAAAAEVPQVASEERRVELPESIVPNSGVDEVALAVEVVASEEVPLVPSQSRVYY